MDRRTFLKTAVGAGAASTFVGAGTLPGNCAEGAPAPSFPSVDRRKLIVVQFGGGTRSSETIDDPEHRWVPHLWNELWPRGTLFTNMRVEGKVVHPNSTGSMMTGHWEYDDLDWSQPVAHPTMFEIFRKARGAPDTAAWAFVYASILSKTAESADPDYGARYAANVVEPPTIPRSTSKEMDRIMNRSAIDGSPGAELEAIEKCARLAKTTSTVSRGGLRSPNARDFLDGEYETWKRGDGTTSHDGFLTDRAIACMQKFAPDVMAIDYGEIDCAHYGSWSRYVEAIRRTDELTCRIWRAIENLPAYRGQTLLLVLPDHGRELERPGRWGFVHHSDFCTNEGADEGCRRVWMLAIGPGVAQERTVERAVPITTAAATGLEFLGLKASNGAARPVTDLMS